jgi:hypothetical protein
MEHVQDSCGKGERRAEGDATAHGPTPAGLTFRLLGGPPLGHQLDPGIRLAQRLQHRLEHRLEHWPRQRLKHRLQHRRQLGLPLRLKRQL